VPQTPTLDARSAVTVDDERGMWSVAMPHLSLRWERSREGDTRLTSLVAGGREWIRIPQPFFAGADPGAGWRLVEASGSVDGNTLRLRGRVEPSMLTAHITVTAHADASLVVLDLEVANDGQEPVTVESLPTLSFATARAHDARLAVLAGGRWDEALPPRGYRLELRDLDQLGRRMGIGAAEDGRSSGEHVPWLALTHDGGGLLAALVWSGRWRLDTAERGDARAVAFGISDFAHRLAPGERIALPSAVVAGYAGSLDDGANAWRRWLATHWTPPVPADWPWIQYNHWYAYYGDIDADRLFEEARLAAASGCEVFVIDDGWFRGRRPDSYYAGWGDWVEDRSKFPDGLHVFGERVRGLGMRFGLWVEPERADDAGELVRTRPDWVATRDGEPIRRYGPDGAEGVHLCLGNPEARRWMADEMIRVVREYGVDWLKWDYNMGYGYGCDAPDHGHQATDGHYAHTFGLYQVLQELRAACPDLMIENCASGGHRIDLGTLRHTHTNWVSDYTHRAASCRQHVQGAGLLLPLAHLNTWTLEERDSSGFRSRMGGAFGVSSFMGRWTDEERELFAAAVEEYRRLRPFLTGDRYLLTGPWHGDWDVWQHVHPNDEQIAILAFREGGSIDEVRIRPRITHTDRVVRVERSSGAVEEIAGATLASDGLRIVLPDPGSSEIVWLTALPESNASPMNPPRKDVMK
jgi:alpha-galactosidase